MLKWIVCILRFYSKSTRCRSFVLSEPASNSNCYSYNRGFILTVYAQIYCPDIILQQSIIQLDQMEVLFARKCFFYEKRHQNAESLFRKKLFKNWVPCRANKYIKIFFLQRTLPTFLTVFFTQAPVIRILKLQQNTTINLGIALKREIWVQFPITMWCFGKLYRRLFQLWYKIY